MNSRSCHQTALALAALALLVTGAAWAQPTPGQYPGSFANDGARQTADGGWVLPYDECSSDNYHLAIYTTQAACEGAGFNWDPLALTGEKCFHNRPQCLSRIYYGVPITVGAPPINQFPGVLDTQAGCEASNHEWRPNSTNGACTDGESRSKSSCEDLGFLWYAPACRAKFFWDASLVDYDDATLNNYNDCTRCHNTRHYPKATEEHHYHGSERSVGETYVMQSHKNMQRPVARDGNDPHYLAYAPWKDKTGAVITQDIFGNLIDFSNATNGGADLWYLRDWIADYPEPVFTGGEADGCARCHSTGFDAAYVETSVPPTKQPYIMFPDFPVDQATGGWDQWGIQCSRCHGSQLVYEMDVADAGNRMDLRHHPGIANNKLATNNAYPTKARCEQDGFTWGEYPATSGFTLRCYDPTISVVDEDNPTECTDALGSWDKTNDVCYYSLLASGATRTNLCADCHVSGTVTTSPVGSQHGLELDFRGHFHANQFLNSPHARFFGNGTQIGDKTKYDTHFQFEGESYPYDNTVRNKGLAGGCTQCHDVHKSALAEANPEGGFIHEECTECHAKNLAVMLHPGGKDTPMEEPTNPNHACEVCHMPKTEDGRGLHFFRITSDPDYEMFPSTMFDLPQANKLANTMDDDGYPAVWVDLDHACGQCHGGGTEFKTALGDVTSGSNVVTNVADTTGFAKGERILIDGAGEGGGLLHSWVSSVGPDSITLVTIPMPATSKAGATVQQNPPKAGIGYISKANLAAYAKGIHNDAPKVNFTYTLDGADTLTALFNAAATTCNGSNANCNLFEWDFGDGQTGTGVAPSHTYVLPGSYTVTLTVTQYGMQPGSKSKIVTTYQPDFPPSVEGSTCEWDPNTWTMVLTDGSTDDIGIKQTAVTWGDGSLTSLGGQGTVFTHTYTKAGTFTVTEKVADTKGQIATFVCSPAPTAAYFTIEGYIAKSDEVTPLSNAKVQLFKDGTTLVKTVYSNITGKYVASGLKPGSYTIVVSRTGYTFTPVTPAPVGPSLIGATAVNIAAD